MIRTLSLLALVAVCAFAVQPMKAPEGSCDDVRIKAETKLDNLVASGTIVDAYYIPTCQEDGLSWTREQFSSGAFGSSSWCVNPKTGKEEPNTRLENQQRQVPCGAQN